MQRVAAGAPVFAQGVADARIHVLRSGLVKLHYFGEQGQEWIKSFLAEGDYFASLSAWDAKTQADAERADIARRDTPKTGCNGYPFSRMRRAVLEKGSE